VIALKTYGNGLVYYPVSTRILLGEFRSWFFLSRHATAQVTSNVRQSIRSLSSIHSLGRDFAVLLDMNVVVGLKGVDFVIGELDRETLYQSELMLNLSA